jgi:hypothetical protein
MSHPCHHFAKAAQRLGITRTRRITRIIGTAHRYETRHRSRQYSESRTLRRKQREALFGGPGDPKDPLGLTSTHVDGTESFSGTLGPHDPDDPPDPSGPDAQIVPAPSPSYQHTMPKFLRTGTMKPILIQDQPGVSDATPAAKKSSRSSVAFSPWIS